MKVTFYDAYRELCHRLYYHGKDVANTKEIRAHQFTIDDIEDLRCARNPSLSYALAELVWYLNGARDTRFIGQFAKMWENISDDGATNNSAYGYILQKQEGFNQIDKIIELLKVDPNSRRAVLNINKANPYVIETKDEPCTIALQFLIRDQELHCIGIMRSNDIYFGTPYDVIYFTTLQKIIADELGLGYGTYTHFVGSVHCYQKDADKLRDYAYAEKKDCNFFLIDHKKLLDFKEELYKISNRNNIEQLCRERKILK